MLFIVVAHAVDLFNQQGLGLALGYPVEKSLERRTFLNAVEEGVGSVKLVGREEAGEFKEQVANLLFFREGVIGGDIFQ